MMAHATIHELNPTLSSVVLALRPNLGLADLTIAEVVEAARARQVPVVEGRVDRKHVPVLYFGVRDVRQQPADQWRSHGR